MGDDYLNSQTTALNPWIKRNGHTTPVRFFGLGTLGAMTAIQPGDGRLSLFGDDTHYPILTQVEECPWTEDEWGIPIDTANAWMVRTRCYHHFDEAGEREWWVLVPRILPAGYEDRGRCRGYLTQYAAGSILSAPIVYDHLGDNPFLGHWLESYGEVPVYWRTPTSDAAPVDGYSWVPMNLNRLCVEHLTHYLSELWWIQDLGVGPAHDYRYWYRHAVTHAGFRGGKVVGFIGIGADPITGDPSPYTGSIGFYFGWTDPDDGTPTTIADINVLWSQTIAGGSIVDDGGPQDGSTPYSFLLDLDVSPAQAPDAQNGRRMVYHLIVQPHLTDGDGSPTTSINWKLGPRHDIPLHYFASTRNRCAPGGVIVP